MPQLNRLVRSGNNNDTCLLADLSMSWCRIMWISTGTLWLTCVRMYVMEFLTTSLRFQSETKAKPKLLQSCSRDRSGVLRMTANSSDQVTAEWMVALFTCFFGSGYCCRYLLVCTPAVDVQENEIETWMRARRNILSWIAANRQMTSTENYVSNVLISCVMLFHFLILCYPKIAFS